MAATTNTTPGNAPAVPDRPHLLPSIETLGRWLANVDREHDRQDNLNLRAPDVILKNAAQEAMNILEGNAEELRNLIVRMAAVTLADAAVQAHAAGCFACQLTSSQMDDVDRRDLGRIVERALLSIVAVVAPAPGSTSRRCNTHRT